jgi:PAS domain S-box-containing protein
MVRPPRREALLAHAIDAAVEALILTDRAGTILQVNPAFTWITGYNAEEAIGQTPRLLKSGRHPPEFYEQLWATLVAGEVWSGRVINRRRDGSCYHAALTIAPFQDESGNVVGYVGVQRDVTSDFEREEALARALEQANAATRAKSEFLAKMSHELRTPLNSIIGFTRLMMDDQHDPPSDKRANRLEKVYRNANNLLALINDILDVSKIEAGRFELDATAFDVVALIRETAESIRPLLTSDDVTLNVTIAPPLESASQWVGDPIRVGQILTNLLGNAAKFTESGRIDVRADRANNSLVIEVEDTGTGIPPQRLNPIFDDFQQADNSSTRRAAGTGLGLSICRRLCQLMGGEVSVRSAVGAGSCFTVRLPEQPATVSPASPAAAAPAG